MPRGPASAAPGRARLPLPRTPPLRALRPALPTLLPPPVQPARFPRRALRPVARERVPAQQPTRWLPVRARPVLVRAPRPVGRARVPRAASPVPVLAVPRVVRVRRAPVAPLAIRPLVRPPPPVSPPARVPAQLTGPPRGGVPVVRRPGPAPGWPSLPRGRFRAPAPAAQPRLPKSRCARRAGPGPKGRRHRRPRWPRPRRRPASATGARRAGP